MRQYRQLAAAAVAAAVLLTPSVFAESRHANRTDSRGHEGSAAHDRGRQRHDSAGRGHDSQNHGTRSRSQATVHSDRGSAGGYDSAYSRGHDRSAAHGAGQQRHDSDSRSHDSRNHDTRSRSQATVHSDRGSAHGYDSGHGTRGYGASHGSARSSSGGHGQPYYAHGRISSIAPHGGGYRVWVAGSHYPFFIPRSHYHHDRFHVGLVVRLGGYYNRGGYYDYYDGYGYDSYAGVSRGQLRGIVESVDYRRGTFVVQNEATGSFVTVASRDRRGDVRAGDYVELDGDWTRSGVFEAFRIDFLDDGYRR